MAEAVGEAMTRPKLYTYYLVQWWDGYKWFHDCRGGLLAVALYGRRSFALAHIAARTIGWPSIKKTRFRIRRVRLPI